MMMNRGYHGMNGCGGRGGIPGYSIRMVSPRMQDPTADPRAYGPGPWAGRSMARSLLRRPMMFPMAVPFRRYRGNPLITLLGGLLLALLFRFLNF